MIRLEDTSESYIVYEYPEAEALIRYLAWANRDDVTPISRGGRGRNKLYYYNYPCSFDIETSTIRSGEMDYEDPDERPIAFPYLYQFNIYGACIFCRQLEEALDVFKWAAQYFIGGSRRRLTFWDHNLGYEWGFFKDHWRLSYDKCFAVDEHHPLTLELEDGIIIRDSYKISNMGLETLTKDWSRHYVKKKEIMDYSKLRTPYEELDKETMIYSCLDVLGLSDAMRGYLKAHDTGNWTQSPTSTSFIRVKYKKRIGIGEKHRSTEQRKYFELLKKCIIDYPQYQMLRRQARGGNTHTNRRITGQLIGDPEAGTGVVPFDIISSYPCQAVCEPEYPIGYWMPLDEGCSLQDIKDLERWGYCTLFDIVLVDPVIKDGVTVPYIASAKARTLEGGSSYSDNGRYLNGAHYLELTLFGSEWPIIEAQYDMSSAVILRGYFAEKGYLPDILRTFILELYAAKTELKGVEGSEVEYAISKAAVNGVFGMAFTNPIFDKWAIDEQGIYLKDPPDPASELERFQKSTGYFLPYAWGCMIATQGRIHLQKMIDAVGPNFLYCDTDSVYASDPKASRKAMRALDRKIRRHHRKCGLELTYYDIKGRPHELGGIDEDPECALKAWGAKKYIKVEKGGELKCTIAGVPKKEGAAIIGHPDNFELDMVFKGKDTGKNCLWYNDDEGITVHDKEGRPIRIYSNIAMLPVDYQLGLSSDYSLCLSVEGINKRFSMEQLHDSMVEDFIN